MQPLKQKAWRNDARAKVTGQAAYTDDLKLTGMLHAVPVYADHVHARIRRIATDEAGAMPGVVRVVTAGDCPGSVRFGQIRRDYPMLAEDRIRSHGDVVAVIVAETREVARAAAARVRVDAEELPALLDPDEAMKRSAALLHRSEGSNIVEHHKIRRGDIAEGFGASDFVLEEEFATQHVEHAYIEPESALCVPRADGVMEVHGSMQHPFSTRRFTAAMLGVALSEVEVRNVPVGGGFGGKDDTAAIVCARAALCARLTGRPVKMTYEREWSIRESYKRHPYRARYRMGVGKDGLIKAVEARIVADAGAYCSTTPFVTWRSAVQCCGPYRVDHVHGDVYGVYTNNVFTGAMRGFGSPQVNFFIEQLIDMAAERAGIDPIEFRRRNMLRQGDETITGQVLEGHTVGLGHVLDRIVDELGYADKFARCTRGRPRPAADGSGADEFYGVGLAMSYRGMSLGAEGMDFNAAIVNVQFDGSILLEAGVHENGQGAESTMILLLAEELGVRPERIRYRRSSTSTIPDGGPTVASRATLMGGSAVVDAARKLKGRIAEILAPRLGCAPEAVGFANDQIIGGAEPIGFGEAMVLLFFAKEFPHALGAFKAPDVDWDEATGTGRAYFTWVYGCQAVELTVNAKTGKVTLLGAAAAHDVGRAINPPMVLGQFYGGMAMGIGYALHEEVLLDGGRITNLNLDTYRIPRARDLPEMKGFIVENNDPNSLSGAKGVAEPTIELMAPAIANALYNATGKRYHRLPMKVEVAP